MDAQRLAELQIEPAAKRRPQRMLAAIFLVIALVTLATALLAWPRASDKDRKMAGAGNNSQSNPNSAAVLETNSAPAIKIDDGVALTVSGYIINRERIEISPRFLGVVKWIGVKKGDAVTNGQLIVQLDDAEYVARVHQSEGSLAAAKTGVAKAELFYQRIQKLSEKFHRIQAVPRRRAAAAGFRPRHGNSSGRRTRTCAHLSGLVHHPFAD